MITTQSLFPLQELKQDISSFRFEVLGMLKGSRMSLRGRKMLSGTSASSHPGCLHQFKIKPVPCEVSSEPVLDPRSSLLNGSVMSLPETSSKAKHRSDISTDFGMFQNSKRKTNHCSNTNIYAVFEDWESEIEQFDCTEEDKCEQSLTQRPIDDGNVSKSEEGAEREPVPSETGDQSRSPSPTDT